MVALITPMRSDGSVDEKAFQDLVEWQISEGTEGLVPVGTTGESPTLSHAEHKRMVEMCVEVARGRVSVIAGAGSNSTAEAIDFAKHAKAAGADGTLVVTPYYNKPTQEGLFQHYRAFAESTPLPIVVYNVPGRTGINVEPSTIARLASIANIVGVKEASGNVSQMCEIVRAVPSGFLVLSGDDALTLPLMAIGGHGIISVAGNEIPAEMVAMVEAAERNDFAAARAVHARIIALMSINFVESNPQPVKYAMAAMGLLDETFRLPMVPPSAASKEKITSVLKELGLLKGALV
jgi:4-hydroxy-tetrahydrodipicolinate synthase